MNMLSNEDDDIIDFDKTTYYKETLLPEITNIIHDNIKEDMQDYMNSCYKTLEDFIHLNTLYNFFNNIIIKLNIVYLKYKFLLLNNDKNMIKLTYNNKIFKHNSNDLNTDNIILLFIQNIIENKIKPLEENPKPIINIDENKLKYIDNVAKSGDLLEEKQKVVEIIDTINLSAVTKNIDQYHENISQITESVPASLQNSLKSSLGLWLFTTQPTTFND